jgi:3-deoxy-D-manno-octulosonic-acid transferase
MDNFRQEAALLLDAGGASQHPDADSCWRAIGNLVADPAAARSMGERGRAAVASQGGATDHTWRALVATCLPRAEVDARSC